MTKPLSERLLDILDNDLSMPECADHVMLAITEAAARLKELEDAKLIDIGGFKYKAIEVRE